MGLLIKAIGISPDRIFTSTADLCDEGNRTKKSGKTFLIDSTS